MDSDPVDPGGTITIGRAGLRQGLAIVGTTALLTVLLLGIGSRIGLEPGFWLVYPIVVVLFVLYVILFHRGDVLILDDDGLAVASRRGVTRYHWSDLLEVGWSGNGWSMITGCHPIVRPKGDRFTDPGPNFPRQISTLAIFGRTRDTARRILQAEAERHGVAFSDRDALMLQDPPPGSPFRAG